MKNVKEPSRIALVLTCFLSATMTVNGHAQNLFLFASDGNNNDILNIEPNGGVGYFARGYDGAQDVWSLGFNSAGYLFATEPYNGTVVEFPPNGGVASTIASGLIYPDYLAVDRSGNVFVSVVGQNEIIEIAPNGNISTFASLYDPSGLAFDASGNLFVGCYHDGTIYKFTPTGVQTTFASGLSNPQCLAFDSMGNLYEADYGSGKIYEFTTNGVQSTYTSGLSGPWGLAIDSAGYLYVSQAYINQITKMKPGVLTNEFAGVSDPYGLAFPLGPVVSGCKLVGNKEVQFTASCPCYSLIIQASTNMMNWVNIETNAPPITFTDSTTKFPVRYYRARLGP